MHFRIPGLFLSLIISVSATPKFIPADESYPLLRRDLVPLDVDSIQELASQLAILADGPAPEDAEKLRHRAKTLTLSQRLAPAGHRARAVTEALSSLKSRPAPSKEELESARKTALQEAQWLIDLPSESEGHRLGQLLLDVLAPGLPKNPLILRRDEKGEAARWRGVLANLRDFEDKPGIITSRPATGTPKGDPPPPEVGPSYKTTALLTEIPMLCKNIPQTSPIEPALIKTSLVITQRKGDSPVTLKFQPNPDFKLEPLLLALRNFFETTGRPLPGTHNLNINTNSRQYLESNGENIAAPIAMMLESALTGRPLRKNTYLFARLAADGTLHRPRKAWELLLHLSQTQAPRDARLIMGPGMEEEFKALLVLQKPSFFVDFEVITAPTFEAARELFYEDGKPAEDLTTAIAGYQEVRKKAVLANSLRTFLSLTAVESRLIKARDISPLHISAGILAIQADRRPVYLSRFMLARELERRLQPVARFQYDETKTTSGEFRDLYKATRESLQLLEKIITESDEPLLKEALDLNRELNRIARSADDTFTTHYAMLKFDKTFSAFLVKLRNVYQPGGGGQPLPVE